MLKSMFAGALALALATPAFAAEPAATPEKPKCECCEKKEGEGKKCCCDKDKQVASAQDNHDGHDAH